MSEYIEIETELSDEPGQITFRTNLALAVDGRETYHSPAAMDEGSPLAQMLAQIEGIASLTLDEQEMMIEFDPAVGWHVIVAEATAVLKEFFL
jgi:hypothetical protein